MDTPGPGPSAGPGSGGRRRGTRGPLDARRSSEGWASQAWDRAWEVLQTHIGAPHGWGVWEPGEGGRLGRGAECSAGTGGPESLGGGSAVPELQEGAGPGQEAWRPGRRGVGGSHSAVRGPEFAARLLPAASAQPSPGCHRPGPQRGSSRKVVLAIPISGAQPVGGSARPELTQNPQGKRSGCLLPLRDADGPAPPPRSPRRSAAARWAAF